MAFFSNFTILLSLNSTLFWYFISCKKYYGLRPFRRFNVSVLFVLIGIVCNAFALTICLKLYLIVVKLHVLSRNSIIWTQHQVNQSLLMRELKSICRESYSPKEPIINHLKEKKNCFSVFSLPEMVLYKKQQNIFAMVWPHESIPHLNYPAKFPCWAPYGSIPTRVSTEASVSEKRKLPM